MPCGWVVNGNFLLMILNFSCYKATPKGTSVCLSVRLFICPPKMFMCWLVRHMSNELSYELSNCVYGLVSTLVKLYDVNGEWNAYSWRVTQNMQCSKSPFVLNFPGLEKKMIWFWDYEFLCYDSSSCIRWTLKQNMKLKRVELFPLRNCIHVNR